MEMNCSRVKRDELIEAYVLGTLDEDVHPIHTNDTSGCGRWGSPRL